VVALRNQGESPVTGTRDKATVLFLQNLTEQGFKAEMAYPSWAEGHPIVAFKEADATIGSDVRTAWEEALAEARNPYRY
jgi:hypothetical protein